jgi:tRNA(Glu) U13 pseudouridine synthase TruD
VVNDRLRIGDLYGNRFSLILRFIENSQEVDEKAKKNFEGLSKRGFINYFGT